MIRFRFRPGGSSGGAQALPPTVSPAGTYKPAYVPWFGINTGGYSAADDPDVELPPIPVEWIIAPTNAQPGQCPSAAATMGSFGAAAAIVALGLLVLGRRTVVHKLTFGWLGTRHGKGVFFTWALSVSLHILSNLLVSAIVVTSDGYERLSLVTVFALYASRPSFSMAVMVIARFVGFKAKPDAEEARRHASLYGNKLETKNVGEFVYVDSYITSAIAEVVLRILAAVFVSVTWARFPDKVIKAHMKPVITYMQIAPFLVLLGFVCAPIWHREPHWRRLRIRVTFAVLCLPVLASFVTASWLYWSYFLELPGSLYVSQVPGRVQL